MKTKATLEVEAIAFERLSDWVIIRSMYKRHEMGALYLTAIVGWAVAFYSLLG